MDSSLNYSTETQSPYGGGRAFLLVLCHGHGADHRQMESLTAALRARVPNAMPVVPDGPQRCRWAILPRPGRRWFPLSASVERQRAICLNSARLLNARIDDELQKRRLAAKDVVIGGFSQGAMVALLAGFMRPVAPRGIIALAGALMVPPGPFTPAVRPPVLLVHGDEDDIVPCARSEEAERRLRAAGIYAHLVVLPGRDHLIVPHAAPAAADFLAEVCA